MRGQGPDLEYLSLASRLRALLTNESVYEIWELYLSKHSTNNIFQCSQATPNIFLQEFLQEKDFVIIRPAKNILGALRLPGDKSISHRYAMLAAIAAGTTRLANFSTGADCASTVACV
ncbi:MAG: 5-Enolpyruvylshikimate-3-phosphate synthase, partial [Candidatus Angelobacter sp.]|nr:5-Enolpyruvylshikimate-3-phosphate synthase [Candidatus Angelobacter sp.]